MLRLYYYYRQLERLRGFTPEKRKRNLKWRGVARVFGFGLFVSVGIGAFAAQSAASTQLNEVSMGVGQQLSELADVIQKPHTITINGEHVFVGSGVTSESMATVLDRFETHCRAHSTLDGDMWSKLEDFPAAKVNGGTPFSVVRRQQQHEGMVMCIVRTDANKSQTVLQSLSAFAKTHDLGSLGALRYAYVKEGKNGKTTVLTSWTEGSFNFDKVFPGDGSEPQGTDSDLAPRPPGNTHRILSAKLDGTPYGVRVYQSSAKPTEVYEHYDKVMTAAGWTRLARKADPDGRGYMKGGVMVSVAAGDDPNGGSSVSIGDLGGGTVGGDLDAAELAAPHVDAK